MTNQECEKFRKEVMGRKIRLAYDKWDIKDEYVIPTYGQNRSFHGKWYRYGELLRENCDWAIVDGFETEWEWAEEPIEMLFRRSKKCLK